MTQLFPSPQPVPAARSGQILDVILGARGDVRPERSRLQRYRLRLALTGVAVAVALAGLALANWLFVSGRVAPPERAAWTTVPQSVSAAQTAQLAQDCAGRVGGHFPISLGNVLSSLAEQRGSSSAVLLADSNGSEAICINPAAGAASTSASVVAGPEVGIVAVDPMVGLLKVDGSVGGPAVGLTAVFGRVTDRASTVQVAAEDGRVTTASVGHGYFLVWWPSGSPLGTVRAIDAGGHVIATAAQSAAVSGGIPVPRRGP
jgi:hypothetical protein